MLIDFLVALAMGVVVLAIAGVSPGWAALTLPLWVALGLVWRGCGGWSARKSVR